MSKQHQDQHKADAAAIASVEQPALLPLEERDLRTAQACQAIGCKKTKLFDLIADREVDSYLDGTVRKITGASIVARRKRLLAQEQSRPRPQNHHEKRRSRKSGSAP
jgi:hypothetical protein